MLMPCHNLQGGLVLGQALLRKSDTYEGVIMYAAAVHANPEVITPFKVAHL